MRDLDFFLSEELQKINAYLDDYQSMQELVGKLQKTERSMDSDLCSLLEMDPIEVEEQLSSFIDPEILSKLDGMRYIYDISFDVAKNNLPQLDSVRMELSKIRDEIRLYLDQVRQNPRYGDALYQAKSLKEQQLSLLEDKLFKDKDFVYETDVLRYLLEKTGITDEERCACLLSVLKHNRELLDQVDDGTYSKKSSKKETKEEELLDFEEETVTSEDVTDEATAENFDTTVNNHWNRILSDDQEEIVSFLHNLEPNYDRFVPEIMKLAKTQIKALQGSEKSEDVQFVNHAWNCLQVIEKDYQNHLKDEAKVNGFPYDMEPKFFFALDEEGSPYFLSDIKNMPSTMYPSFYTFFYYLDKEYFPTDKTQHYRIEGTEDVWAYTDPETLATLVYRPLLNHQFYILHALERHEGMDAAILERASTCELEFGQVKNGTTLKDDEYTLKQESFGKDILTILAQPKSEEE